MKKDIRDIKIICISLIILSSLILGGSILYVYNYGFNVKQEYSEIIASIDKTDDIDKLRRVLKGELSINQSSDLVLRNTILNLTILGVGIIFLVSIILYRLRRLNKTTRTQKD